MRVLAALVSLLLLAPASPALAVEPQASLPDIEDEVMCVECGTALNLSTSGVADREREFIASEIAAGKTKEEIKDGLVDRFGPSVLALPDDDGFGLAAYLVPAIAIALAFVGVLLAARRWRGSSAAPAGPDLSAEDSRRVDEELKALD